MLYRREQGLTRRSASDDYDGILAGAPANNWTRLMHATVDVTLPGRLGRASRGRSEAAEQRRCRRATSYAVEDGCSRIAPVGSNLRRCRAGSAPGTPNGGAARGGAVYGEPRDRAPVRSSTPLPFGSELAWQVLLDQPPFPIPVLPLGRLRTQWNWKTFDPRRPADYAALQRADSQYAPVLSAIDPTRPIPQRGGKLIQYHGWNDQLISAENSIATTSVREVGA
jgi:feruloyl esterase